MVTSEGIKTALDDKLDASSLVTNFNSANDTTIASTLAIQNLVGSSPEWGMALGTKITGMSSSLDLYDGTWNITTSSNLGTMYTQNSNTEVVVPQAKYMWFFMAKHAKTNEGFGSNAAWSIHFERGDGTDYQAFSGNDPYGTEVQNTNNLHGFRLITGNTRFQVKSQNLDELQPYFFFVRLGT